MTLEELSIQILLSYLAEVDVSLDTGRACHKNIPQGVTLQQVLYLDEEVEVWQDCLGPSSESVGGNIIH